MTFRSAPRPRTLRGLHLSSQGGSGIAGIIVDLYTTPTPSKCSPDELLTASSASVTAPNFVMRSFRSDSDKAISFSRLSSFKNTAIREVCNARGSSTLSLSISCVCSAKVPSPSNPCIYVHGISGHRSQCEPLNDALDEYRQLVSTISIDDPACISNLHVVTVPSPVSVFARHSSSAIGPQKNKWPSYRTKAGSSTRSRGALPSDMEGSANDEPTAVYLCDAPEGDEVCLGCDAGSPVPRTN